MSFSQQIPPIFVISLRASPRRPIIAQRLTGLDIPFQFVDAVYGKELSPQQLEKIDYDFYPARFAAKKPLTLGEIGCAMSHINIYEYMRTHQIERAIILEDDAIVSQEFKTIIKDALNKLPPHAEILFFEHGKAKQWPCRRNLVENYRLAKYISPSQHSKRTITRTTAYLITLKGSEKLLKYAYPIRMPSDYLTGALQITNIRAYGIEPPCVFRGIDSEIDELEQR